LKFQFNIYQHLLKQPLLTSHGTWQIREGIIISLSDGVNLAQGEIAPLSWFGSETMAEAVEFCHQLGSTISTQDIDAIPDHLPACQFGLESALFKLNESDSEIKTIQVEDLNYCYLLPAGAAALTAWEAIYQLQGNNTFKWKIGVYPLETEISVLQQLVKILPAKVQLRLDANGGLDFHQAKQLLTVTDHLKTIEFVEQPLAPECLTQMLQLSQEHTTLLGLDESVASFSKLQLAHQQGWEGIFVVKAAIMGFPSRLMAYCQQCSLDVVFSSVLETEVGRNAVLKLAQQLDHPRAVGFGVNHYY
jgi:o-succinylbenzoate synthase